jgi:hypothetical protein
MHMSEEIAKAVQQLEDFDPSMATAISTDDLRAICLIPPEVAEQFKGQD